MVETIKIERIEKIEHIVNDAALPEIVVNNRQLRDVTDDTLQALYKANKPEVLFVRNARLTRINVNENNRPFTEDVSESALRSFMARAANFIKITKQGKTEVHPPLDVVRDILVLPVLKFAPLIGLVESPVIRKDGTVLNVPGYDARSKLFFYPDSRGVPGIPEAPTEAEVKQAVALVNEAICDFPFENQASHDNALALMFTPVINPLIDDVKPGVLIDKPQAGTGASLLCRIVNIIATGQDAGMQSLPDSEEEIRKYITSLMIRGQSLLIIDNVEHKFQSESLAALLTSRYWRGRILGQSKEDEWPNNVCLIVNGNNVRLGGDMPRRFLWVRMDAKLARPFKRDRTKFKHPDLIAWITNNRNQLLSAILTIARAWVCAGRPIVDTQPNLGGYERYSLVMGGIMNFIGAKEFMANLDDMYEEKAPDDTQWMAFFTTWYEQIKKPVTVTDLKGMLDTNPELKNALPIEYSDINDRGYSRRLGIAISKNKDKKFINNLVLRQTGEYKHLKKWMVVSLEAPKNEDSPQFSFKSESGESCLTVAYTKKEGINLYRNGAELNSPNSPLASKTGESLKNEDSPLEVPDVCRVCGDKELIFNDSGVLVCSNGHAQGAVDGN